MTDALDRLKTALADRYAVQRELGSGGMATVYLARDLKHNRHVAVKVLRPELSAILGADRFLHEIEVTANLQHPNILPLYDSGEADTFLYYVMPYVEGETLRDRLSREKQLSFEDAVEIAKGVAAALTYAHSHGVIHRDIKPENILLESGQAVVADFGIALAVSTAGGNRLTESGLSLGTPQYMSPEQATGDRDIDARSDVYALGAVVYEMLVGDPPHTGSTVQAIIAKILSETPSPVRLTRELVPRNVEAAVHRALAKTPADRFATAAQFAEALSDPSFSISPILSPATVARRAGPPTMVIVVAALGLLALAAAAGWFARAVSRPEPPKPVLRLALRMSEGQEALPVVLGTSVALSPDGSRLVYVGGPGPETELFVRDFNKLDSRPLPGTEGAWQVFFSPDGERVGFITERRDLNVIPLSGEPPVTLASGVQRMDGAWSNDGYVYFVPRSGAGLHRIRDTGGGDVEVVSTLDTVRREIFHFSPDALPNGGGVLFSIGYAGDSNEIGVVDVTTGEHHTLMTGMYARYATTGHLLVVRSDGALLGVPFDQDRLALTGPATPLLEGVTVGLTGVADMTISRNGTLVYLSGGRRADPDQLVWIDRDGSASEVDPGWTADFSALALSPDGTKLAITVREGPLGQNIWIKQLDRGPLSRLTFGGNNNRDPTWTNDGQSVTFVSDRGGNWDFYVKRADGSPAAELVLDLDRPIYEPDWSPDGKWLVFTIGGEQEDIYGYRPGADSAPAPLVADAGFNEVDARISPDGRWLAYVSDETGRDEVYVRPFPSPRAKWLVSANGGTDPRWAHSGRELFYRSGTGPYEMVTARVLPGPTFAVGERRVLFPWGTLDNDRWDPTPSDQRFVFVQLRDVTVRVGGLVMVENFFEELKAKVGK